MWHYRLLVGNAYYKYIIVVCRLIFTMDPKNGEISRAMRNRGVEIYLGAEEIVRYLCHEVYYLGTVLTSIFFLLLKTSAGNALELKTLLDDIGIRNLHCQSILGSIHNNVTDCLKSKTAFI